MNFNVTLSNTVLEKYKCASCQNHLSFFPVYIMGGEENLCGRCPPPSGVTYFRNKVYENLVQFIKFPCRYKGAGCNKELQPKEMNSHEMECFFKPNKCPGVDFLNCNWEGCRSAVLQHCQQFHEHTFLNHKLFELDMSCNYLLQRFLEYNGTVFLVSMRYYCKTDMLICSIYHYDDDRDMENYSFQLILSKNKMNVTMEGETTIFQKRKECQISLASLKAHERLPIAGRIVLEGDVDSVLLAQRKLQHNLLSLLVCSKCGVFVLPPIYQYGGESLQCDECRPQMTTNTEGVRNFSLDNIAQLLDYPCRYTKNGCKVVLKADKMCKHVRVCLFKKSTCPLKFYVKCNWLGLQRDLVAHIQSAHPDRLKENNETISLCYKTSSFLKSGWSMQIVQVGTYLFVLKYFFKQNIERDDLPVVRPRLNNLSFSMNRKHFHSFYTWEVFSVNHVEEKFKYEIEVVNSENNRHLVLPNQDCLDFDEVRLNSTTLSIVEKQSCWCTEEQILSLMTNNVVSFKVHVFEA